MKFSASEYKRLPPILAALCAIVFFSCHSSHGPSKEGPPNVLLISIDTLRANHMGCYGYGRDTTPVIDKFAEEAILYRRAYSSSGWTLPAHVTMLSGSSHLRAGVLTKEDAIPESTPMLAESLAEAGYQTVAFVDSLPRGFVGGERGFSRGFHEYYHAPHQKGLNIKYDMKISVDKSLKWLDGRDEGRPFFIFLHTKSVHATPAKTKRADHRYFPYDKPDPYRFRYVRDEDAQFPWSDPDLGKGIKYLQGCNNEYLTGKRDPSDFPAERLKTLVALYDAGIHYTDFHLGRLLQGLRNRSLFSKTIIVITADHGESFLDHHQFMHEDLYDENIQVPLLVRLPNHPERLFIDHYVGLEDIVPTLLDSAGIPIPDYVRGQILPMEGNTKKEPRIQFSQMSMNKRYLSTAVRAGDWTLIQHNFYDEDEQQIFLYDTGTDPGQKTAIRVNPEKERAMLDLLLSLAEDTSLIERRKIKMNDETLEHLRSLGYLQ